ncbi:zinc finger protein 397-like isoform X2 [Mastacembelus armatus]|uniref:zinc finger protein 397-like isoform X2 n=1 Tax=Mastacembelus armatus TaxID=205130 RepID=UPI001436A850|nr:zinc finger protein 397-like isoform X2 [Mastacembelus armatus]
MSFPSAFGTQVAAIMDVLAKAAVAEITKLVEDGTVVLRLEMCRRASEIQELKRSLNLMEAELCKAQEAATTRARGGKPEQTTGGNHVSPKPPGGNEAEQIRAVYLEPESADSLYEPQHGGEDCHETMTVVKHEPADEPVNQQTTDGTAAAACNDLIWPPAACSMFEVQQHIQPFPSHTEPFSAHVNTQSSYDSSVTATGDITDDSLGVPVKVQVEILPVRTGSSTSESVHNEHFRRVSSPAVSQSQCLQSTLQQAGPSLAPLHPQRPTADTAEHVLGRSSLRLKKLMSQKVFTCSVCSKSFARLSQLEAHKSTHQTLKPFRCLECGKCFTQKTRLRTHQSVHTGERPFRCKICGKMFSRQDNCMRHERFHSGLKPYSCGQCGKSFTVLSNLKIHHEIHLQGR